jgi:HAMP domain-containing protein
MSNNPLSRLSLLWKILLSTSVAITALFAVSGWIAVYSAKRAMYDSIRHEAQASFQAYQSLWKSRADRLSSISSILSAMSDVRAAFRSGDEATIRDTAGELWAKVSDEEAFFLVTTPRGDVIASLGGRTALPSRAAFQAVRDASGHFPAQVSGFLASDGTLYHVILTPVYVQTTGGTALLNVLAAGYAVDRDLAFHLKQDTGGSEFLFLAHGQVVASTLPASDSESIARNLRPPAQSISSGGIEYAPLITPLTDIHGAVVGQLAILRSYDTARREISALGRNISLLWLASMIAGLALTYWPARRIVEPVKELDRAAARVARQDYDCTVPVTSQDELGRLASTFNAMCASIREARDELIRTERIATVGRLAASIVHAHELDRDRDRAGEDAGDDRAERAGLVVDGHQHAEQTMLSHAVEIRLRE